MLPVPRTPSPACEDPPSPGPHRRRWFRIAAILLPILMVVGIEGGLRGSGLHRQTRFWIPAGDTGQLTPNPGFAARFVGPSLARMPRSIVVDSTPPAKALRILMFGESAALGDPDPAFGVGRFLQALLEYRLPDRRVEVINTAITALNSHAIREAARDSRDLKADFWILYSGNNEVIGPFGPASVSSGRPPSLPLIRLGLALRRTALGQWITDRQAAAGGGLSVAQRWAGLEQYLERPVPAQDPSLSAVRQAFGANLRDIIHYGLDSGARVVVSTMAVNLADCPPLGISSGGDTNSPSFRDWKAAVDAGRAADERGEVATAVSAWTRAAALRTDDAETRYQLGQARLNANDPSAGRQDLERARDLDTLRFRADSAINQVTRDVAAALKSDRVELVDAERELRGDDPARPPGADLFFEHVHLRPEGNYKLARLFADAVVKGLENPPGPAHWPSLDACLDRLGWTPVAASRVWSQIRSLTQRPPFSHQSHARLRDQFLDDRIAEANQEARTLGLPAATARVKAAVDQHPEDWELREQLVKLHQAARQWTNAVIEEQEVLKRAPFHVVGWLQLGESLEQAGEREAAVTAYQRALDIRGDFIEARIGLARVLGESGRHQDSLSALDLALRDAPDHLLARVNRGITLLALNRDDEGVAELRRAARDHPTAILPLVRLAEVLSSRKAHAEACQAFTEAIAREPGNAPLLHRAALEQARAGTPSAAEALFRRSLEAAPEFGTAHLDLGVVLAQQGRFAEAIPEFEAVLRIQPGHAAAQQYLDLARRKMQETGGR